MSNIRLNIQQLRLRCRGISPAVAETAVRSLGPELLQALAKQQHWPASQSIQINRLDLKHMQVEHPTHPQQITPALTRTIATAITQALPTGGTRP